MEIADCEGSVVEPPALRWCLPQALLEGASSPLLAALHMALIRVMQADMEEAYASGAAQV
jgi:hypothetical protein